MTITNNPDLEFKSIESEASRTYVFPDHVVTIKAPLALNISASGGHRVLDAEGTAHYIPRGWRHLYWKTREGKLPFAF